MLLHRYSESNQYKKEIETFIQSVNNKRQIHNESSLSNIGKSILFFKILFQSKDEGKKHYMDAAINDMFSLVYILTAESERSFYSTFRSLIENMIRVILDFENNNEKGINAMFKDFKKIYPTEYIYYLEGEYSKFCDVVHSNIRSDISLSAYFEEVEQNSQINDDKVEVFCKKMVTFYRKSKEFYINNKTELIMNKFYNQDEVLCLLLGQSYYTMYKQKEREL
jgi:hypothetical protein